MIKQSKNLSVWNWRIVRRAIVDALLKLNPRAMMKNPVMFVVEVGSLLTTIQFIYGVFRAITGITDANVHVVPLEPKKANAQLKNASRQNSSVL